MVRHLRLPNGARSRAACKEVADGQDEPVPTEAAALRDGAVRAWRLRRDLGATANATRPSGMSAPMSCADMAARRPYRGWHPSPMSV